MLACRPVTDRLCAPIRVVLSGAAGQIGYQMIPLLTSGQVFGLDQPLILALLEIAPALKALAGVALEIEDGAYPLVDEVIVTADAGEAFKGADYAILVGGFPRKAGMLRKDLLAKNSPIFKAMGEAMQANAKDTCKVIVIANPANSNCLVASKYAPKIPKENFSALTRLDFNRACAQVASKIGRPVRDVRNVIIWGNHSATQVPDTSVAQLSSGEAIELEEKWVREDFTTRVQKRGKEIIVARGFSSAMSAANATKDALRDWVFGTAEGSHVAMAVYSKGNPYGIADDIFYSFPVSCAGGKWQIVPDIAISDEVKALMKASEKELLEERAECGIGGAAAE